MEKRNLEKLSKTELIKLLLKEKKKPETIVVPPKKKQKVDYNLDNLFNDDIFSDSNEKKINKVSKTEDFRDYPMKEISLDGQRKNEMRLTTDKKRAKMSFMDLFETRLENIPGGRESVSISINIEIKSDINGLTSSGKTYGPFSVEKPVHMSKADTYKFALCTLLNSGFSILSGERISAIGFKIIKLNKKKSIGQEMGGIKLESYLLNKQRPIKIHGINTCVVDYVWDQVRGKRGFKT